MEKPYFCNCFKHNYVKMVTNVGFLPLFRRGCPPSGNVVFVVSLRRFHNVGCAHLLAPRIQMRLYAIIVR